MKYIMLGNKMPMSVLGYGSWLDTTFKTFNDESKKSIKLSIKNGINHFDNSCNYGNGESQQVIGKFLAKNAQRWEYTVSTKAGFSFKKADAQSSDILKNTTIMSSFKIQNAVEKALHDYDKKTIDLFYLHFWNDKWSEELMIDCIKRIDYNLKSTKILHYGLSNFSYSSLNKWIKLCKKLGIELPIAYQASFSILDKSEVDTFNLARANGIGTLAYSPLYLGILTGKYNHEEIDKNSRAAKYEALGSEMNSEVEKFANELSELSKLANDNNTTMTTLAYAYLFANDLVDVVLMGAYKPKYVQDALDAREFSINKDLFNKIDKLVG